MSGKRMLYLALYLAGGYLIYRNGQKMRKQLALLKLKQGTEKAASRFFSPISKFWN